MGLYKVVKWYIQIWNIDNLMKIELNDVEIYNSGIIHEDPSLNIQVDILDKLIPGQPNKLKITGYNSPYSHSPLANNPAHFFWTTLRFTESTDPNIPNPSAPTADLSDNWHKDNQAPDSWVYEFTGTLDGNYLT